MMTPLIVKVTATQKIGDGKICCAKMENATAQKSDVRMDKFNKADSEIVRK